MDATFTKKADFSIARFTGEADFSHCTFAGEVLFFGATFNRLADFSNTKFSKTAHFNGATFTEGADADFSRSEFSQQARLMRAVFKGRAYFFGATFTKECYLRQAIFHNTAFFSGATFTKEADFILAEFSEEAKFTDTSFSDGANFRHATFTKRSDFTGASFTKEADFYGTTFAAGAGFSDAKFLGRTVLAPLEEDAEIRPMFSGTEVDFRGAIIAPPDALILRDVDLEKCRFEGTDLRKAEITRAKWPRIGSRYGVYDEIAPLSEGETRQWPHIERVYRELKQNCEERRDYERAREFHYGEKEMRRKNPETSRGLWLLLTLYRWVSGYGERCLPPLLWAGLIFIGSTLLYLWLGLCPKGENTKHVLTTTWDWLGYTLLYSFQVMTLLKPDYFEPVGLCGRIVYAAQSLLGPLLIGLFALALRQRLKR